MIRKYLILLGLLLIPSFSFASNNVKLDIGEYSDIGGNNCTVNSDLSFDCSNTDNVIVGTDSSWLNRSSSYFRTNSGLAYYGYTNSNQSTYQGYVSKFKYCGENGNPLSSCNSSSNVSYDSFIEYYNSHELTNRMWYSVQSSDGLGGVAFIFGNSYFVFAPLGGTSYVGVLTSYNFGLSGWGKQANYGTVGVIDTPIDNFLIPIQDTIPITDDDIIDYYENNPVYNFNKDMCYIGTYDLSSNYEDRITYYQGSGYTIYEFFGQLYGNSFKLSDLDIWLNSWLVNFNTFFNGNNRYSDGTPWYVLRYNGIGNLLIDKNNLDNPFLNNKSAYYFMASTIYDSYKGYGNNPYSEDIAVYCYKKTNVSSNIEFNPPNGIRNNIGNWVNNKKSSVGFSGWSIIQGESWNGTPLDYFTGDNIVYTGFDSFFKTSFNRFVGIFNGLDVSDIALGQLPSYIIGFLMLLILFRFLSH